jgi:nicotinamide mononucleotide transporter
VYGWYHWAKKNNAEVVSVEWTTRREWVIASLITLIGWGTFYYLLKNFSNSDVPLVDGFVSATACSGMWLLAKRKIENWLVLNISNLVAIPLLFHKKLIPTAVLTIFLFIVAVFGYFSWQRIYKKAV